MPASVFRPRPNRAARRRSWNMRKRPAARANQRDEGAAFTAASEAYATELQAAINEEAAAVQAALDHYRGRLTQAAQTRVLALTAAHAAHEGAVTVASAHQAQLRQAAIDAYQAAIQQAIADLGVAEHAGWDRYQTALQNAVTLTFSEELTTLPAGGRTLLVGIPLAGVHAGLFPVKSPPHGQLLHLHPRHSSR